MKKIIIMVSTTIMCLVFLSGCLKQETYYPVDDVLETISVRTQTDSDFELVLLKNNVELTWVSDNEAIYIDYNYARVNRQEEDVKVTLTCTAVKGEDSKESTFDVLVLKKVVIEEDVYYPNVLTIEEVFEEEDDTDVKLEALTVQASNSYGTHFTDGENVIFAYGTKNEVVGEVYDVVATKTTYGTGDYATPQLTGAELTKSESESSSFVKNTISLNELENYNSGCFEITAFIDEGKTTIYDDEYIVDLASLCSTDVIEFVGKIYGEVKINAYLTGSHTSKTLIIYDISDITISETVKPSVALNDLSVESEIYKDIELEIIGMFDLVVQWSSNNELVLSSTGVVSRQEEDVVVTLTATIEGQTKTFEVTVLSIHYVKEDTLFISEYYMGNSGNNKYIEIYNPNDVAVDLSAYSLMIGINGAQFSTEYKLSGMIQAHSTYVVAHTSANDMIKELITNLGDMGSLNYVCNFNGNDSIGLFENGVLVDIFGVEGENPGDYWAVGSGTTKYHRIIRNPGVMANPVWDPSEWTATEVIDSNQCLDDFGIHTFVEVNR